MIKGGCRRRRRCWMRQQQRRPIPWSNNRFFGSSPSSNDGILSMHYLFDEKIPIGISSLSSFLDNESLTQSAIYAFEHYQQTKRGSTTTSLQESSSSSNSRRRHRQRPTKAISQHHNHHPSNRKDSNDNDHFFEYQKMQGFMMSSSIFRDEPALAQLHAYLFHQVCPAYLMMQRQDADNVARGIAQELRKEQQGDASTSSSMIFALDLWASVHNIPNNDTDSNSSYHHGPHVHEDAILSGVYYASVPSDNTPLQFFAHNPLEASTSAVPSVLHEPIQGQVIVFPPWLWHAVPKIQAAKEEKEATVANQPRVAFAFNLRTVVPGALDSWSITKPTYTN